MKLSGDGHRVWETGDIRDNSGDGGRIDIEKPIRVGTGLVSLPLAGGGDTPIWPEHALQLAVMFGMALVDSGGNVYRVERVDQEMGE